MENNISTFCRRSSPRRKDDRRCEKQYTDCTYELLADAVRTVIA
jgi:hypothetical protein